MTSNERTLPEQRDALTRAWRSARWEELATFMHPAVVFLAPYASVLCTGPAASMAGYQEFVSQAIIHSYEEGAPHLHIVAFAAMTTTPFTITYEVERVVTEERGTEALGWVRHETQWLVTWRMLVSDSNAAQAPEVETRP